LPYSLFLNDKKGANVPLLIYFRGEIGLSSILRTYVSFGPLKFNSTIGKPEINPNSITKYFHLLAIDYPITYGMTKDTYVFSF